MRACLLPHFRANRKTSIEGEVSKILPCHDALVCTHSILRRTPCPCAQVALRCRRRLALACAWRRRRWRRRIGRAYIDLMHVDMFIPRCDVAADIAAGIDTAVRITRDAARRRRRCSYWSAGWRWNGRLYCHRSWAKYSAYTVARIGVSVEYWCNGEKYR